MKQNSQWLSQVRTRSNTALDTSTPSDSPARLSIVEREVDTAAADVEVDLGVVGGELPLDDVARHRSVDADDLVAHRDPVFGGRRPGGNRHDHGRSDRLVRGAGAERSVRVAAMGYR